MFQPVASKLSIILRNCSLDWISSSDHRLRRYNVEIRWWRRRWRRRSIISWHPLKSIRAKKLGWAQSKNLFSSSLLLRCTFFFSQFRDFDRYVFHSMKHEARMWRGSVRSNDITGSSGVFSSTSSLRLLLKPRSPFDQVIVSEVRLYSTCNNLRFNYRTIWISAQNHMYEAVVVTNLATSPLSCHVLMNILVDLYINQVVNNLGIWFTPEERLHLFAIILGLNYKSIKTLILWISA